MRTVVIAFFLAVLLPASAAAAVNKPGTSEVGSGRCIQVVHPSRFFPFHSGVQPTCGAW